MALKAFTQPDTSWRKVHEAIYYFVNITPLIKHVVDLTVKIDLSFNIEWVMHISGGGDSTVHWW